MNFYYRSFDGCNCWGTFGSGTRDSSGFGCWFPTAWLASKGVWSDWATLVFSVNIVDICGIVDSVFFAIPFSFSSRIFWRKAAWAIRLRDLCNDRSGSWLEDSYWREVYFKNLHTYFMWCQEISDASNSRPSPSWRIVQKAIETAFRAYCIRRLRFSSVCKFGRHCKLLIEWRHFATIKSFDWLASNCCVLLRNPCFLTLF